MTEIESFFQVYRDVPKATGFSISLLYGGRLPTTFYAILPNVGNIIALLTTDTDTNDKILASCQKYIVPYSGLMLESIVYHIRIHEFGDGYVSITPYAPQAYLVGTQPEGRDPGYLMECDDIASILGLVERKLNGN